MTTLVSARLRGKVVCNVSFLGQNTDHITEIDEFDFEQHSDVYDRNIGWELDIQDWSVGLARRAALEDQTNRLADLLEKAGISARLNSEVTAVSLVTNIATPLVAFRPVRFLPSVAARDRRPMLNALKYWMDQVVERPDYVRYVVVTSGDLVPAFGNLRERMQDMSRSISKWAHYAREEFDIHIHFRGSEFTRKTAGERGLEGYSPDTVLYHPHCNILLEPKRKLPKDGPKSWDAFLKWSHDYLEGHWHDNGRIKDVREIVKYVVKPADLLEGESPIKQDETKWLYESLFRLNLAQPLGEFKEFYSQISANKLKVIRVKNRANNKGKLRLVKKSTRLDHSIPREKSDTEAFREPTNIMLGITMPNWSHTPWAEPAMLVRNYDPETLVTASEERLKDLRFEQAYARMVWDKAGAPTPSVALELAQQWASKDGKNVAVFKPKAKNYKVHNSSLTVREDSISNVSKIEKYAQSDPPDKPKASDFDFDADKFQIPDLRLSRMKAADR